MKTRTSRRAALVRPALALVAFVPLAAYAHKPFMVPSETVLSAKGWITVDAAVSNDLFYFNHQPLRIENNLTIIGPDGGAVEAANLNTGKFRTTFDVNLAASGTYKLAMVNNSLQAAYEGENGERKRWRGTAHQLSRWDSTSALSALNASRSEDWQSLPPELFTALTYAISLAADTGGAYDPTVAPLVDAWGFGTHGRRYAPPSSADVAAARALVGWQKVELDAVNHRVRRPAGTQLDLSSMTHGFAADQVAAYLRSIGLQRHLVDVGSEIRASGDSSDGHPWRVAVERPPPESGDDFGAGRDAASRDDAAAALRVVALRDAGIATSGNYRYYFDYNGRRYSHRIDPRTAEPITHPLLSVTVIASEGLHADALATALTVLGPDEGFDYARRRDIAALFVVRTANGFEQRMTPRFAAYAD